MLDNIDYSRIHIKNLTNLECAVIKNIMPINTALDKIMAFVNAKNSSTSTSIMAESNATVRKDLGYVVADSPIIRTNHYTDLVNNAISDAKQNLIGETMTTINPKLHYKYLSCNPVPNNPLGVLYSLDTVTVTDIIKLAETMKKVLSNYSSNPKAVLKHDYKGIAIPDDYY